MLKSASGRMVQAVNPLTYIPDPKDRQKAMDKAKHMGGNMQDRMEVLMSKIRAGETVVIDVAVIKATMQNPKPPKDKHVAVLKMACAAASPRMQVQYTVHKLSSRLEDKPGWLVALKTLMVFHRLMREVDPSFQDEIIRYQERTGTHRLLRLDSFADHTTKDTWDMSAWIRVYSVYLDDRLAAYKSIRFDPEAHNAQNPAAFCKLDTCGAGELLDRLPVVQKLLARIMVCVPEGAAATSEVSLYAAALVLREVRAVYKSVSEGIINLTDKFFDMERPDALRGLDIFKENMQLNERLNAFFGSINTIPGLRGAVEFPELQSLPTDFLTTMEEYVRDAPRSINTAKAGPTGAGANTLPSVNRTSSMARQGGTTSGAITGTASGDATAAAAAAAPFANGGPPPAPAAEAPPAPAAAAAAAPEPLRISPPAPAPAPPKPPPNAIDLLGDDFPVPTPPMPPAQPYGAPPPFAGPTGGLAPPPFAGPTGAGYGAPPPFAGPTGGMAPPPFAGPTGGLAPPPPFAGPTGGMAPPPFAGPTGSMAPPPFAGPTGAAPPDPWATAGFQQPLALPPPSSSGFGFEEPAPFGGASASSPGNNQLMPFNPYGGPALTPTQPGPSPFDGSAAGQVNPYGGLSLPPAQPPLGGSTAVNPFGGVTTSAAPNVSNPFDATPPAFSMAPPAAPQAAQQQQHWGGGGSTFGSAAPAAPSPQAAANMGWNTSNPTLSAQRQAQDPLRDLSFDLFGQPQQTVPPSLKDLRVSGGM